MTSCKGIPTAMPHGSFDIMPSALVVSADTERRALLSELLARDGYRVTQAEGATDALWRIESRKFDLVVTGILMFEADGLELLRAIGALAPDLPVIVIGDASPKINHVYLKCAALLGAVETHTYPPESGRFLESARQAIDQSRAKQTTRH
jgi:two-component system chemotaxis response regulator CheY